LAEVLQIACRHALAMEPTEDQRTVQVQQVLPGIRFAGLRAQQQALPGLIHAPILPFSGRAREVYSTFLTCLCKVFRRPPIPVLVGMKFARLVSRFCVAVGEQSWLRNVPPLS